jgi:hypothetical protein
MEGLEVCEWCLARDEVADNARAFVHAKALTFHFHLYKLHGVSG